MKDVLEICPNFVIYSNPIRR